jgi:hypothetical protein
LAKILRARKSGQPGFTVSGSVERATGREVSSEREGKRGVRILLTLNPAKHQDDPLGFTNHADIPNPNATPRPGILNGSIGRRLSTLAPGLKRVRNRSTNRSIKKL